MGYVESDAGQEVPGLHGDKTDNHAHQRGHQRLLQDGVREAEKNRAPNDCPPLVTHVTESREDEAAEGDLFADGRQHGDQQQHDSEIRCILEKPPQGQNAWVYGVKPHYGRLRGVGQGVNGNG